MSLENESVDIKAFTQRQRENFVLIFTKCLRGGGGERGESINFIRNNNQSKFSLKGIKPKRHNCASAHHSLNVHYNVKRSLTKAETKKGRGGGGSGVASFSLLDNPFRPVILCVERLE